MYSSADYESFNRVDLLKKWIDRQFGKDKKEVPIVVLANMRDRPATVDSAFAHSWAAREKVKLFEVTAKDRQSLVDFIHYVGHRHFHPTSKFWKILYFAIYPKSYNCFFYFWKIKKIIVSFSEESKFSLSKKLKSEKSSNPAILMDFWPQTSYSSNILCDNQKLWFHFSLAIIIKLLLCAFILPFLIWFSLHNFSSHYRHPKYNLISILGQQTFSYVRLIMLLFVHYSPKQKNFSKSGCRFIFCIW